MHGRLCDIGQSSNLQPTSTSTLDVVTRRFDANRRYRDLTTSSEPLSSPIHVAHHTTAIMPDVIDPRMMKVQPRIRYNTIGGVNGPLVFLDNVCS